jgi:hypothetical protein
MTATESDIEAMAHRKFVVFDLPSYKMVIFQLAM